jgi:hypothetical protein
MPTPENERSAITAFLHVLRVRAVEKERNTDYRQALYDAEIAIKQGEHTK